MKFSRVVSVLLHPLWLPVLSMLVLLNSDFYFNNFISQQGVYYLLTLVSLDNVGVPLVFIFLLKMFKLIESYSMKIQHERQGPLLFSAAFMVVSARLINQAELPSYYWFFLLCTAIVTGLAFVINTRYRISLHMLGWGSFTGILLSLLVIYKTNVLWLLPISFFLSGLVGWARLKEESHNNAQVYIGYVMGLMTFPLTYIWL